MRGEVVVPLGKGEEEGKEGSPLSQLSQSALGHGRGVSERASQALTSRRRPLLSQFTSRFSVFEFGVAFFVPLLEAETRAGALVSRCDRFHLDILAPNLRFRGALPVARTSGDLRARVHVSFSLLTDLLASKRGRR